MSESSESKVEKKDEAAKILSKVNMICTNYSEDSRGNEAGCRN